MKSRFRNNTVLICLLTSIGLISCGDSNINIDSDFDNFPPFRNTDFKAFESISEEVVVGNGSRVSLQGKNGNITVTSMSGASSVLITGTKIVGSDSTQDAEDHLPMLEVHVQSLANDISIETIQPQDTEGRQYVVDYAITLPNDSEIQISNSNGIVTLDAIDNDVTVNNTNGDVTLTDIAGSAEVSLVNGSIESEVTLPLNGTIDLRTVNGNINLSIPADTSAGFSADVTLGTISDSNLVFQSEVRTSTSLSGTLGNGQGTISLETGSTGDINISGF